MDAEMQDILRRVRANIDAHGWHVTQVLPGATTPSFAYSVGMTEKRRPEILMIGFEPRLMHGLINDAGRLMEGGAAFGDWSRSDAVVQDYPVVFRVVPRSAARKWARMDEALYGRRGGFTLLQMFLPDERGLFPWDEGCHPNYARTQGVIVPLMKRTAH